MRWSLSLGKLFGIKIKVHWTFFLLILWVVMVEVTKGSSIPAIILMVAYVLAIFACIVFHETGHALMARRFNVPTKKITLLPIGGVASLQRIPEKPREELLVAIAGPIVNVGIAAIIYPFLAPLTSYFTGSGGAQALATITPHNFLFALFSINLLLVLFNLLPAFPMDGGRMLRALLAMRMNRIRATHIASSIGQVLAVVFFFTGLFFNPFLLLIGVFVFFGARGENMMVQQYEVLRNHRVEEAMITDLQTLDQRTTLKDASEHLLSSCDDTFVIADDGDIKGFVTRELIMKGLKDHKESTQLKELIDKDYMHVKSGDKLSRIMELIQSNKQSLYPVMDNGKVKGIVNMGSLQRFIAIQSALHY